jgi:homoserine dehydrogenase
MKKQLNIGLFGFGAVGQGLYEVLQHSPATHASIKSICIKNKAKERLLPPEFFTTDANALLGNPEINLIVELIDDADEAYNIVKAALSKGKSVVSGNKKMLAHHLPEFIEMQRNNGVGILYDASACGSIPVIRNLEEYYDNDLLQSVTGILNGSSNYILSKMSNENLAYADALKQAQDLGFAESNPALDVDGFDALYKLIVITVHAFGVYINPDEVFRFGISNISKDDISFAKEKGFKIKLVAHVCKGESGELCLYVIPRMVPPEKYIYNVEDEFNGVVIKGAFYGKQFMFGRGAGGHPTGSAVLSDITALGYNYRYEYKKMQVDEKPVFNNKCSIKVYFRFKDQATFGGLHFDSIEESYNSTGLNYVIGRISLEELFRKNVWFKSQEVFIAEIP